MWLTPLLRIALLLLLLLLRRCLWRLARLFLISVEMVQNVLAQRCLRVVWAQTQPKLAARPNDFEA
jgi:hypothetical protein